MGASPELIGLYWTTSGPVEVHVGREWSLFDLRDRCEQAARVGFAGIGLWHADLEHVLETRTLREVRQLLDDNGLRHLELEFLGDWFLDPDDERRTASDARRALLVRGGRGPPHPPHQGRATSPAPSASSSQIVERFGELCEDAARGTRTRDRLRVHAVRRQRERHREGARGRRGRERAERRARPRHLAPRQAATRAGGAPPHPAAVPVLGRALRTGRTSTRRTGSTR